MEHMEKKFKLELLKMNWGAPIVARSEVKKFSGGLLHPRTMANLDSKGLGPQKIHIGGRVAYDVDLLIAWMEQRTNKGGKND